ncbi:MAG: type II toxin-antitoxin system Phd/YefM family antitoxin [Deltaproteobacteria bacterium]|nr:MAG: type II toxin-antitoxin system Phd/YefM family antitoxin [Deltaproteobacteria bacterium]
MSISTISTISSRKFNQDIGRAKKAAKKGPVIITDRGRPAYILLTIEKYQKLTETQKSILDFLAMPGLADMDFDIPRLNDSLCEPADLF